jgi:hypothetical protein
MKTVFIITSGNPDGTQRFVAVKGTMVEATSLVEELNKCIKTVGVDVVAYQILTKHL